jgi:hypothetical protein
MAPGVVGRFRNAVPAKIASVPGAVEHGGPTSFIFGLSQWVNSPRRTRRAQSPPGASSRGCPHIPSGLLVVQALAAGAVLRGLGVLRVLIGIPGRGDTERRTEAPCTLPVNCDRARRRGSWAGAPPGNDYLRPFARTNPRSLPRRVIRFGETNPQMLSCQSDAVPRPRTPIRPSRSEACVPLVRLLREVCHD